MKKGKRKGIFDELDGRASSMIVHADQLVDGIYSYKLEINGEFRKSGEPVIIR